ncbi:septation ring formation regulator EzrA [Metabacillus crassostreae]|uniref:hypothetical protein n=1 Tax=Metabacillus crassostreae TaxID=929098 RepID=UPI001959C8AF|nr:hypothetical protein [Metabacillus crassostreae]MBM7605364.1 septation ring formation regulator EzrA [Metabacillus crassostreae]
MEELLKAFMKSIDSKFTTMEGKFESIDKRFANVEEKFESIDRRFANVEEKFESIDRKFTKLENNQQHIITTIENHASEFRSHFVKIETELEQHREAFSIYAADVHKIRTDIDYLSSKTGIHDTKLNNIEKRLEV